MIPALLLIISPSLLAAAESKDFAAAARTLFESVIDFKLENDLLVVHSALKGGDPHGIIQGAWNNLPGIGSFHYSTRGSGGGYSRGGGGWQVNIDFEPSNQPDVFRFSMTSGDGSESMTLHQESPGKLSIEYRSPRSSFTYAQTSGKCKLRLKAGMDSALLAKKNFSEVCQANHAAVEKHVIAAIERFFDKVPGTRFVAPPPGKVVFDLRDGTQIVGTVEIADLKIATAYGVLTLPRGEIREIFFPGAPRPSDDAPGVQAKGASSGGEKVVMKRFAPVGKLETEAFEVKMSYGALRIATSDILHMAFGPVEEEKRKE